MKSNADNAESTSTRQRDASTQRSSETRLAAFASLGKKLSSAKTAVEAGSIIVELSDEMFGWDSCTFGLYSPERDEIQQVISYDIVGGKRTQIDLQNEIQPPSPRTRRIIERGAELIL